MGRFDVVKQERKVEGFDLLVTHRDEKTGLVTMSDPYTLRVCKTADGDKTEIFERPPGSGNCFAKNGEQIGRWIFSEKKDEKTGKMVKVGALVADAAHVKTDPPMSPAAKQALETQRKDSRIAELEKELAAIQAEKEKKTPKGS